MYLFMFDTRRMAAKILSVFLFLGLVGPVVAAPSDQAPLLTKLCTESLSGSFAQADVLMQQGYRRTRKNRTNRQYYMKIKVSFGRVLNGVYHSAGLALRLNSRRNEKYCTIDITSSESVDNTMNKVKQTLAQLGYNKVGETIWHNGVNQLRLQGYASGNRNARTVSVIFTAPM